MGRIERRSLTDPDEIRGWPLLTVSLLNVGSLSIGYGTVKSGWRWSTHMHKATDEPLCRVHHLQLLLSGRFAVQMDDGEYTEIEPNDVFDVPPGHDAWVIGDEPVVLVDFLGNIEQLGRPASKDRIVTTLLMTDIVDSTGTASRLGETTWKQRLGEHNRIVRLRLERYLGKGGKHDRGWLPRDVRQHSCCDPLRRIDPRRHRGHRAARPDRRPYGGGRPRTCVGRTDRTCPPFASTLIRNPRDGRQSRTRI